MNRARLLFRTLRGSRLVPPLVFAVPVVVALSCQENLPTGPDTFPSVAMALVNLPDTLVLTDSRVASTRVTDAAGHVIQDLTFSWTVADTNVARLSTSDTASGRSRTILPRRGGVTGVTASLTDTRFTVPDASKQVTVVSAGVRMISSKDTSLTALNDTAVAVGSGLIRVAGLVVPASAQGIKWVHKGVATTGVGQGDSLRYVAKANGVDTLIVSVDYCLAGARCADTTFIRVTQAVKLTLTAHGFNAWNVNDSVGPSITLTDKRGNGLAGSSIRFVPVTLADSTIASISAPVGTTNTVTGQMAAPRIVTRTNGTARVRVLAIGTGGATVDADSVTVVVRQVARQLSAEPQLAQITEVDSIPMRLVAKDSRGNAITDATLTPTTALLTLTNGYAIGVARGGPYTGTITTALTGVADPANNPAAPQVPFTIDTARISVVVADSATAGTTSRTFQGSVITAPGVASVGAWVRFFASTGTVIPDSVQTDINGVFTPTWIPGNVAGRWTFNAFLTGAPVPVTAADSAGRFVLTRSVFVNPSTPNVLLTTAVATLTTVPHSGTTTITVTVKDVFGNVVVSAGPGVVTLTATGTFTPGACTLGVCTYTYTAPAVGATDTITATIAAVGIAAGPITITLFP